MFSYLETSRLLCTALIFPNESLPLHRFSIDTRTLVPGDLFVALKGENSDGHQFLCQAFEKGASGALIELSQKEAVLDGLKRANVPTRNLIVVQNTQEAMTELAAAYRKSLPVKVVGITGSVGKTTTKEFLFYLLRQKYSVLATSGNLNNHLGVPIMLSRLEASHQFCVLEMGASHPGEIRFLTDLGKPSGGILTPIGPAHLEGFGSLENVYDTKLELADSLEASDPLVVPDSDEHLLEKIKQKGRRAIMVGLSARADYRITDVLAEADRVSFSLNEKGPFSFPGQASFLVLNAALAIAMARSLGISWDALPREWMDVGFASGRFRETILPNGVRVIDDSYNANPVSFKNALATFQGLLKTGRKILVFADMLEMGKDEDRFHRELGEQVAISGVDLALAFGKRTRTSIEAIGQRRIGCVARHFEDPTELLMVLKETLRSGDLVLFKGSRSMHVEKILAGIKELSLLSKT